MNSNPKIGTIISQDNPQVASLLAGIGFDFIFIDLEHGHISDNSIAAIIVSKVAECKIFIRIRAIKEANIKHALDLGCDGIIAPRLETLEELQTLIDYSYYPPQGKRSVGFSLANKFGISFKEYAENFKPTILAQIESTAGLAIAKDIVSNNRIDGIFMGPYDLSMSMGIAGNFDNPTFKESVKKIQTLCKEHNKEFGTFSITTTAAKLEIEKGCDLIAIGIDSHILLYAYQNILQIKK